MHEQFTVARRGGGQHAWGFTSRRKTLATTTLLDSQVKKYELETRQIKRWKQVEKL